MKQKGFAPILILIIIAIVGTVGFVIYQKMFTSPKTSDNSTMGLVCPENGWVDCMPILDKEKQKRCSKEAMDWYKANCPNFKGGAL